MPAKKKAVRRRPVRIDRAALKAREVAIIADLKSGHLSYRKIAAKHGVSLPTVNAKARKAGIRRPKGRRPAAAMAMRAGRAPVAAKARRRVAKKVLATVAQAAKRKKVRRVRRAPAPRVAARGTAFSEAFRAMVLHYFPSLTLAKFDRLSRIIAKEVG